MPVPYDVNIRLSILSKLNEDALQIVEQILPYFQPNFNVTIDLVSSIGEKRDIPIVLNNISMQDDYEGDYTTRRSLIYTLDFTAKTYLFGPAGNQSEGLIKKVQVDYYSDTSRVNASRQLRYIAEPRALRDYNSDETTVVSEFISKEVTQIEVSDATPLIVGSYIQIGEESMYIREIDGNKLLVNRGQDTTPIGEHEPGTPINVIDQSDSELIEFGDDFGFSEYRFDYGDGRIYSSTKGEDV